MSSSSPRSVSDLLHQLVTSILPESSTHSDYDDNSSDSAHSHLHGLASAYVQGGPRSNFAVRGQDEAQIVQQVKREIALRAASSNPEAGVASALQFDSLYRRLRHIQQQQQQSSSSSPFIQHRSSLLYFLQQLAGSKNETGSIVSFTERLQAEQYGKIRTNPVLQQQQNGYQQHQQQQLAPYQNSSLIPQQQSTPTHPPPSQPLTPYTTSSLTESDLLRDILYVLLGQDGNHIKYIPSKSYLGQEERYALLPGLNIPTPQRVLIEKICQLGVAYRTVNSYVTDILEGGTLVTTNNQTTRRARNTTNNPLSSTSDKIAPSEFSGKIEQSFASALREELNEYIRFVTLLETQIEQEMNQSRSSSQPSSSGEFTLRRMYVWIQDASLTLSILSQLVLQSRTKKGGEICTVLGTFLLHGNPLISSLIRRLLQKTAHPLFEMIQYWLQTGEIQDPYSEFFIAVNTTTNTTGDGKKQDVINNNNNSPTSVESIWFSRYTLRPRMIPSFFSEDVVRKIRDIGKAVNFIRMCCKETKFVVDGGVGVGIGVDQKQMFTSSSSSSSPTSLTHFTLSINRTFTSVSSHLLTLLLNQHHFLSHVRAIKRYLLLSAGDFSSILLELCESELDKNVRDISHASLLGLLEQCKYQSSTTRQEKEEVLQRLSVKRFSGVTTSGTNVMGQHGSVASTIGGEDPLGWDIFTLEYILDDSPLRVIFTERNLLKYSTLFSFLWRIKRVEQKLSSVWAKATTTGHSAKLRKLGMELMSVSNTTIPNTQQQAARNNPLESFLRNISGLRHEMSHFITHLHSYMMYEVLECAWVELKEKVEGGGGGGGGGGNAAQKMKNATSSNPLSPQQQQQQQQQNRPHSAAPFPPHTQPSSTSAPSTTSTLDLDSLITAHKIFLQQILDKALMGGESGGVLYGTMITMFKQILAFCAWYARLMTLINTEIEKRTSFAKAVTKSEAQGKWNTSISSTTQQRAQANSSFAAELRQYQQEFTTQYRQEFHSSFLLFLKQLKETGKEAMLLAKMRSSSMTTNFGMGGSGGAGDEMDETTLDEEEISEYTNNMKKPTSSSSSSAAHNISTLTTATISSPSSSAQQQQQQQQQQQRARRMYLHLSSLDFLQLRIDYNEFYAVNRKEQQKSLMMASVGMGAKSSAALPLLQSSRPSSSQSQQSISSMKSITTAAQSTSRHHSRPPSGGASNSMAQQHVW